MSGNSSDEGAVTKKFYISTSSQDKSFKLRLCRETYGGKLVKLIYPKTPEVREAGFVLMSEVYEINT